MIPDPPSDVPPPAPEAADLLAYVRDMLHELAGLALGAGEGALAASVAMAALQAGATLERLAPAPRRAA